MNVAVVILNWNGRSMLERFMPSVVKYSENVIVADNGSTDDSLVFLEAEYPEVRVIRLDRNYGFAEGYNKALAQVDADYYVLLNSDVECTPRWLEAHPHYGGQPTYRCHAAQVAYVRQQEYF